MGFKALNDKEAQLAGTQETAEALEARIMLAYERAMRHVVKGLDAEGIVRGLPYNTRPFSFRMFRCTTNTLLRQNIAPEKQLHITLIQASHLHVVSAGGATCNIGRTANH